MPSVNEWDAVVGWGFVDAGNSKPHAFISGNSGLIDLNAFLPPDSGWVLERAFGVNNFGDVVGYGET
jgi:hypothetical protein